MRADTRALLDQWKSGGDPSRELTRSCVRAVLQELVAEAPGRSVELRVPPFGAVQLIAGPVHRRGTPKATVEMPAEALLNLATGDLAWHQAVESGAALASGERTDLSALFPL